MDEIELARFIDRAAEFVRRHRSYCCTPPWRLSIGMDHTIAGQRDADLAQQALRHLLPDEQELTVTPDAPEGCIDFMVCPLHGFSGWCDPAAPRSPHPGEEGLPPGSEG